jgi:hypothetical protein
MYLPFSPSGRQLLLHLITSPTCGAMCTPQCHFDPCAFVDGTYPAVKRTGNHPARRLSMLGMERDPQILQVARILLRKHGTDARGAAQQRADEGAERGG